MSFHNRYWSCSAFADWLRGTRKPTAESSSGWRVWRELASQTHPWRYWLAEEGLDHIQNFLTWPAQKLYDIKYYINNRFISRTHALTAHRRDIKPGQWCDVGNRFLPCLFNELVDFVEVELAWFHLVWEGKKKRAKYNMPWWAVGWWRVRLWRCPQAGLDNLDWQMNLVHDEDWVGADDPLYGKPTLQAEAAKEIHDLYQWWTVQRPSRPDPYEASGWSAICERRRERSPGEFLPEDNSDEERAESKHSLDLLHKLEEEYEAEDEAMMIRLIKIRRSLWT